MAQNVKIWLWNWVQVSVPSFAFFGCELVWAIESGYVTPEFESLGLSDSVVNYVWLAGPISGIIVQPIVGVISDSIVAPPNNINNNNSNNSYCSNTFYSPWIGKRRPFILTGSIFTAIALVIFSNCRWIARNIFLSDNTDTALGIAIVSFWLIDLSNNVVQAPLRALLSDIIKNEYHDQANGMFGLMNGFGSMIGYIIGYYLGYNSNSGITQLFGTGAVLVIFTSALTLILSKNERPLSIESLSLSEIRLKQLQRSGNSDDQDTRLTNTDLESSGAANSEMEMMSGGRPDNNNANDGGGNNNNNNENNNAINRVDFGELWQNLVEMPKPMVRAFIVQVFAFFAYLCLTIYFTDWFGEEITHGDANESNDAYKYGVKLGNLGFSIMAAVSIIFSLLIADITDKEIISYKISWMMTLIVAGISLCLLPFTNMITNNNETASIILAIVLVSTLGVYFAGMMVVPWIIVTKTLKFANHSTQGLYTTIFNIAQCIPQIIVALISGEIVKAFDNNAGAALFMGGIASFVGAFCCLWLIEPKEDNYEKIEIKDAANDHE